MTDDVIRPGVVTLDAGERAKYFDVYARWSGVLAVGPLGLFWWQWLALPVVLLVSLGAGALLRRLFSAPLGVLAQRTASDLERASQNLARCRRRQVQRGSILKRSN
jgi:hypothetical protein